MPGAGDQCPVKEQTLFDTGIRRPSRVRHIRETNHEDHNKAYSGLYELPTIGDPGQVEAEAKLVLAFWRQTGDLFLPDR